jgi:hypothetical protein
MGNKCGLVLGVGAGELGLKLFYLLGMSICLRV